MVNRDQACFPPKGIFLNLWDVLALFHFPGGAPSWKGAHCSLGRPPEGRGGAAGALERALSAAAQTRALFRGLPEAWLCHGRNEDTSQSLFPAKHLCLGVTGASQAQLGEQDELPLEDSTTGACHSCRQGATGSPNSQSLLSPRRAPRCRSPPGLPSCLALKSFLPADGVPAQTCGDQTDPCRAWHRVGLRVLGHRCCRCCCR